MKTEKQKLKRRIENLIKDTKTMDENNAFERGYTQGEILAYRTCLNLINIYESVD